MRVYAKDINGLIRKTAKGMFACPSCDSELHEPCRRASGKRMTGVHAGRWKYAEKFLRPHTHPGLFFRPQS